MCMVIYLHEVAILRQIFPLKVLREIMKIDTSESTVVKQSWKINVNSVSEFDEKCLRFIADFFEISSETLVEFLPWETFLCLGETFETLLRSYFFPVGFHIKKCVCASRLSGSLSAVLFAFFMVSLWKRCWQQLSHCCSQERQCSASFVRLHNIHHN